MAFRRQWKTKDGTVHIKVYAKIAGRDAKSYKQEKDAAYRAEMKFNPPLALAAPVAPFFHSAAPLGQSAPAAFRKASKVERVPPEVIARMRELRSLGLRYGHIGKLVGLSRYVCEMALIVRE